MSKGWHHADCAPRPFGESHERPRSAALTGVFSFRGLAREIPETLEKVTEKIDKLTVFGGLDGVLKDVVRIKVPG